jgi:hypothetical protein
MTLHIQREDWYFIIIIDLTPAKIEANYIFTNIDTADSQDNKSNHKCNNGVQ